MRNSVAMLLLAMLSCVCVSIRAQNGREPHRPQFHFSPAEHWTNDPNGMVYYDGLYHLFFQYYPNDTKWGPMHWGHATSPDMIRWQEQPVALYPDSLGYIFSGSAVIDEKNTSGFRSNDNAPMVAIFTHHDPKGAEQNRNDFQYQSLAYSNDKGRTWKKYAHNPVLANPGITDFRDPKVRWYEPSKKWIMTLATKDRISFYSSPDLKKWTRESEFGKSMGAHGGVWECPDLFPLTVNGKPTWVLLVSINPGGPNKGSATQYFTGRFDGKTFTPADTVTRWMDYGPDNYAGVTFSNTGNRTVLMGWMNNWLYADRVPTEKWRGAMTIPRELSLRQVNGQSLLVSTPVKELDELSATPVITRNLVVRDSALIHQHSGTQQGMFRLELSAPATSDFGVVLSNPQGNELLVGYEKSSNRYFIDRSRSGKTDFAEGFAQRHYAPRLSKAGTITLSMVADVASMELFADSGLSVMTEVFFPAQPMSTVSIRSKNNITLPEVRYTPVNRSSSQAVADAGSIYASVYPTHWWPGMKWNKLQLLLHGNSSLAQHNVQVNYPGVTIDRVQKLDNERYLAVYLNISPAARPGTVNIRLTGGGNTHTIPWQLKPRRKGKGTEFAQGVRSNDFIYLLMPDRFSNGDTSNDRIAGMRDQSLNRDSIFLRHGGDLQGVANHLDYLKDLGVTALWMTPVIENDMPNRTEHGYAFTNHYKIEPRLGGEEAYKKLSSELHARGMKLIQDAVYNHIGLQHFLMQDPPAKDWVHQWPEFTRPNYREQTHFDPHGAAIDKKIMTDGWFTSEMPDLNQGNPLVADFLIQHALWCVEEFGVDGWRVDTYIYVDLPFMNRCNRALRDEYPNITMFGESWVDGVSNQAYFARNNYQTAFHSNPSGTIDFQMLFKGILPTVTQPGNGVNQLYQTLASDFLYEDPMANVIFLDNHDMSRFYSAAGENLKRQKMGLQWLLTERGIPEMYYGTEVLMKGISNPDGWVRLDFPGGWTGDQKNAFTGQGLTSDEQSIQQLVRKLANYRKSSPALKTGKLMHYVPQDGLYVYFRYAGDQTVMCAMNTSTEPKTFDVARFRERTGRFTRAKDVITGATHELASAMTVPGEEMWVMELL